VVVSKLRPSNAANTSTGGIWPFVPWPQLLVLMDPKLIPAVLKTGPLFSPKYPGVGG
jgi:hypothetical protein